MEIEEHGVVHYCEEGDDALLRFLFRYQAPGTYVEVGANHPIRENVTYLLSRDGWRGLSVDANSQFRGEWSRLRPHDAFEVVTLHSRRTSTQYVRYSDHTLNSISSFAHEKALEDGDMPIETTLVETETLDDVLKRRGIERVNLLSINARSADLEILNGLNFDRTRPDVIRIEMLYFNFNNPTDHPIYRRLRELGYALVIKSLRNAFWVNPVSSTAEWLPDSMLE